MVTWTALVFVHEDVFLQIQIILNRLVERRLINSYKNLFYWFIVGFIFWILIFGQSSFWSYKLFAALDFAFGYWFLDIWTNPWPINFLLDFGFALDTDFWTTLNFDHINFFTGLKFAFGYWFLDNPQKLCPYRLGLQKECKTMASYVENLKTFTFYSSRTKDG